MKDVFQAVGVDITPLSCMLVPISHFATIARTTVNTRRGDSYDAAVCVLPIDRLGKTVQEVPFGEESFCRVPDTRTTMILESNPRTSSNVNESTIHIVLSWEQLRHLRRVLKGQSRPRKQTFANAVIATGICINETDIDVARRQYYAYIGGPLDEVELFGLYDAGFTNECTMDDIMTFLPDEITNNPKLVRRAYNQWKSVMMARTI